MAKRLFLFCILIIGSLSVHAQEILVLKDGGEIKCRLVEITNNTIRYQPHESNRSNIRSIDQSDVLMILYDPERSDQILISRDAQLQSRPENTSENGISSNLNPSNSTGEFKGTYFMGGFGYGNSYGGVGIMAQMRFGGDVGIGIHAGAGYFPDAPVLASGGIKFYPYRSIYLNAQFGYSGLETHSETTWSSTSGTSSSFEKHLLYGPSLLIGSEWTWGTTIGIGVNAGIGGTYLLNTDILDPITYALDLGIVLRF